MFTLNILINIMNDKKKDQKEKDQKEGGFMIVFRRDSVAYTAVCLEWGITEEGDDLSLLSQKVLSQILARISLNCSDELTDYAQGKSCDSSTTACTFEWKFRLFCQN